MSSRFGYLLAAALLLLPACVRQKDREGSGPLPRIDKIFPDKVIVGQTFNIQKDGRSALAVVGAFFGKGARILINEHPLPTTVTDANTVSALLGAELLLKDSVYAIVVDLPDGRRSNAMPLIVLPASGPAPVLSKLHPAETKAGQGFNVQPNGKSAIVMTGTNFLPGAALLINGVAQETNFNEIDRLSAFFDQKFYRLPGRLKATVRNPDGKESAPVEFIVR